jgi:chromosome segregation ATPase
LTTYLALSFGCPPVEPFHYIQAKQAELQSDIDGINDNPQVLVRHLELKKEISKAEKELAELEHKIERYQNTYIERVKAWKKNVADVVKPLNINFSNYMKALNFRGEVSVVDVDTIDNYEVIELTLLL